MILLQVSLSWLLMEAHCVSFKAVVTDLRSLYKGAGTGSARRGTFPQSSPQAQAGVPGEPYNKT